MYLENIYLDVKLIYTSLLINECSSRVYQSYWQNGIERFKFDIESDLISKKEDLISKTSNENRYMANFPCIQSYFYKDKFCENYFGTIYEEFHVD